MALSVAYVVEPTMDVFKDVYACFLSVNRASKFASGKRELTHDIYMLGGKAHAFALQKVLGSIHGISKDG